MKNGFWILVISFVIVTYISKALLTSNTLYFNSYADEMTYEQIKFLLDQNEKWSWLSYMLIPLIYFFKCSLIAMCLGLGCFITTNEFAFKRAFRISVTAEFIFLLPVIIKLLWFLFIQTDYRVQDIQYFYPMSLLQIFTPKSLEPWLIYPLQVLNIFELIYWIVLAYLLTKELPELDMNRSMTVVMASYGTGLVIWVAFVMFLTLTYT